MHRLSIVTLLVTAGWFGTGVFLRAQDDETPLISDLPRTDAPAEAPPPKKLAKDPPGMTRLHPESNAWIDAKHKRVVVDGEVALTEGPLEMFACIKGTKEHESVVAVDCKAYVLHAALMTVGAEPGAPAQFNPTYKPASGTPIDIVLVWNDGKGNVHRTKAQDWVKNFKTGKTLDTTWVFCGSGFYKDEETGEEIYRAEGGDLICVSNFPSAMLDLPIESSDSNNALAFSANTEAIPPRGTKVRLVMTPRIEEQQDK